MDYTCLLEKGIVPEKIKPEDSICIIGFCEHNQKWYGWNWTGRICGFGIGAIVKENSCIADNKNTDMFENPFVIPVGFEAKTLDDCKRMAIAFANSAL